MNEVFTEAQLRKQGLEYFSGDSLAANVWITKYALKNRKGQYLEQNPDETIQRLTKEIVRAEKNFPNPLSHTVIYNTLKDFKYFIFGGSILFGMGNNNTHSSLGNCFFIDNSADSYGGIFNIEESMVQLMKRRGGVGITLEHIRPGTALVNNAAQSSTGAVSFMPRFSNSTREVAQDGRRGALMISMLVSHPDIMDFIMIKDDLTKITGANVSVKVTDEFMKAVENDEDYILSWPVHEKQPVLKEHLPYEKLHVLENGTHVRRMKAKTIWKAIVQQAHKNAEPGVLFWDNVIKESPADMYAKHGFITKGTNPCGEVPLSPYDSCRLGSVNIFPFVSNEFTKEATFNWDKLAKVARRAQRFMDDVVFLEEEKINAILAKIEADPEDPIIKRNEIQTWNNVKDVLRKGRRTGVGLLGLADAMAGMGITFGTPEATKFAEDVQRVITINSYKESVLLAEERGAFEIWDADTEALNPFIRRVISDNFSNAEYDKYLKYGRRNIANISIAPTGSLAILAQTTSGIEPVFKIYYRRRKKVNPGHENVHVSFVDQNGDSWEEYNVIHKPFIDWVASQEERFTFAGAEAFLSELSEEEMDKMVAISPWSGSESHAIDYMEKINMQAAIQKWVDHSISVTHNLPADITTEEVDKIYFHGWKSGCKGLTIYRDGSRTGVLITGKEDDKTEEFKESKAPKRPKELFADYYVAKANGRQFAVIVGLYKDTGKPYEIFALENPVGLKNTVGTITKVGKGSYKFINGEFFIDNIQNVSPEEKALTLTASMLLRHGASIPHILNVIKKIDDNVTSFSSVLRRYLSRYIPEEANGEECPEKDCDGKLIMADGCVKCPVCGYSKCG